MSSPSNTSGFDGHSHEMSSKIEAQSDARAAESFPNPLPQTGVLPQALPHAHTAAAPEYHEASWSQESHCLLPPISLVSTCEEMNPSKRSSFEDCSIYAPSGTWNAPDENMAFLAIADGHGGRDIVEFLEDGLLYHVSHELQIDSETIGSIPERLERSFLMADIHSKAMGLMNSGATVAACLVTRGYDLYQANPDTNHTAEIADNTWRIYAANAGDARIVLGHGGKAHRMTRDHRTDDPDEVRRIEESGGFVFKGRVLGILAVTRSLGDHCMKEYVIAKPYTSEKNVVIASEEDTSFIILACDGLWDVFKDQEAVDFVLARIHEREVVAKYLVEEALKRGSTDNITVSVAFLV